MTERDKWVEAMLHAAWRVDDPRPLEPPPHDGRTWWEHHKEEKRCKQEFAEMSAALAVVEPLIRRRALEEALGVVFQHCQPSNGELFARIDDGIRALVTPEPAGAPAMCPEPDCRKEALRDTGKCYGHSKAARCDGSPGKPGWLVRPVGNSTVGESCPGCVACHAR